MQILEILFIAIGLSMDVSAVSICNGICGRKDKNIQVLKIASVFALFHAIMPFVGWLLGAAFRSYIHAYDHWIALILLSIVGVNMIRESMSKQEEERRNLLKLSTLMITSFAVSIDALAVGISFSVLDFNILLASLVIGGVTFIMASIFLRIGIRLERYLGKKMEFIGGSILILIGIKITIEHILYQI